MGIRKTTHQLRFETEKNKKKKKNNIEMKGLTSKNENFRKNNKQ